MLTRRNLLRAGIGLVAASTLPLLSGCTRQASVRVGIHTWIGYETLYLSDSFGWLPPACELISNRNASESLLMLIEGDVQVACLTLDEVLQARAAGVPVRVALVFNVSAGADMVVSRQPLTHLSELRGHRIGYEHGAVGSLMLHKLLEEAGLSYDQVRLIDLPPDQQLDYWRSGEVDVLITYEPTASRLLAEGGQRIFDSRQMPERIFDVLAVREDRLNRRGDATVTALTAAHFRAQEYIRRQHQDALYRIATRQQIPYQQVQTALGGVHLPSLHSNRQYLSGQDARLLEAGRELEWLMVRSGLISRPLVDASLFSPRWLPRMEERES